MDLGVSLLEYLLLVFYTLVLFALLIYSRRDFGRLLWFDRSVWGEEVGTDRLWWRRLLLFLGLLLLVSPFVVLLTGLGLRVPFAPPDLPPPDRPDPPPVPFASLMALPVIIAGVWLGAGPALLVPPYFSITVCKSVMAWLALPAWNSIVAFP